MFFFEKKNQKTFVSGARAGYTVRDSQTKVFCFFFVTPKVRCHLGRRGLGCGYPDKAWIKVSGVAARVWRMFQPCFRAVEITVRRVAKVAAPAWLRKLPDIFIFTYIMRISCSA